VSKNEVNIVLF